MTSTELCCFLIEKHTGHISTHNNDNNSSKNNDNMN